MASDGQQTTTRDAEIGPAPAGLPVRRRGVIPAVPREVCWRCRKAACKCVCGLVPAIANRTQIVILQFHRERRHALGTVRLLRLALARVRVEVAYDLVHPPLALPADTCLLYPKPGARDVAALAPAERPSTVLVLDGTWAQVRRLLRHNPWLHALPCVGLTPQAPSRYRLRLQPRPQYISSLEAVVQVLRGLEPETGGLDALLAAFDEMIAAQAPHVPPHRR